MSQTKEKASSSVNEPIVENVNIDKKAVRSQDVAKVFKNDQERTLDRLKQEDKVRIMIPLGINEKRGASATLEVAINGVFFRIKKGQYEDVPKSIADVVMRSQDQTEKSLDLFSLERSQDISEALS